MGDSINMKRHPNRPYLLIKWDLDENTPAYGLRGMESETVPVEELVRWAKRRRRNLRQVIARGHEELERKEREEAAEVHAQARKIASQRRLLDLLASTDPSEAVTRKIVEIHAELIAQERGIERGDR